MAWLTQVRNAAGIEAVARLAECIWRAHYTPIIGSDQVAYMLAHFQSPDAIAEQIAGGMHYHLLHYDGTPVGYCAWQVQTACLFLSKLYVLDGFRGRGLARRVLQAAVQAAHHHGLVRIALTVNRHNTVAIAAYERMGFRIHRQVCADIGGGFVMDDHEMELLLVDRDQAPQSGAPQSGRR
ncbi:MAG: GNAT family N-acetyltransferase [Planctomycetota bacterium]